MMLMIEQSGASRWRRRLWIAIMLPLAMASPLAAEDHAPKPAGPAVNYMIVVTGGELLAGLYPDEHTQFLTRTLHPLGLHCVGSMTVEDKPADIKEALQIATRRVKLVIVTGGLGPTENDVTRQSLSEFTGVALAEQPDVLREIERRFKTSRDHLRPNLLRQTQVPVQGTYLKSPHGTAVGLVFETPGAVIVALPGPSRELQPMVRNELVPYLNRRFGAHLPGCSILLRFAGLGQSQISQEIDEHVRLPADVIVFSQFEGSRVDYTFSLPDDTPQDRARLEDLKRQILAVGLLSDCCYAGDETTLEERVAKRLAARGLTLAVAEAGSGGSLAAALGGEDHARQVLAGAYVAPLESTLRRLLQVPDERWNAARSSRQKMDLLAAASAELTRSPWAVAVSEVRERNGNDRSVEVVFRLPDGRTESQVLKLHGSGELARANLTTQLLDQLRRHLR
jgi:nicotinamide-nucleotide amidase